MSLLCRRIKKAQSCGEEKCFSSPQSLRDTSLEGLAAGVTALCGILFTSSALAQASLPYVPPELYRERRWLQGEQITLCVWSGSPLIEFEREIGRQVGETLLINVEFEVYDAPFPLTGDDFWETVYIQLAENCDAIMGFSLVSEMAAEWLIPTRPYYLNLSMFVTASDEYEKLGDVPAGSNVGSLLHTDADVSLLQYQRSLPDNQRWTRYPFSSVQQAFDFLDDGRVEGIIMPAPSRAALLEMYDIDAHVEFLPLDPLPVSGIPIGMMLREHNIHLRSQLDTALEMLVANGTIDALLVEFELPGTVR